MSASAERVISSTPAEKAAALELRELTARADGYEMGWGDAQNALREAADAADDGGWPQRAMVLREAAQDLEKKLAVEMGRIFEVPDQGDIDKARDVIVLEGVMATEYAPPLGESETKHVETSQSRE
jgi:hypothetical protein